MLLNSHQTIYKNLLSIYGIGKKKAINICELVGLSTKTKLSNINTHKKDSLNAILTTLKKTAPGIEQELKLYNIHNITRLIKINSYRRKKA